MILFINFLLLSLIIKPLNLYKEKNKVILHIEKFNNKYNLYHIGISFSNEYNTIRFDYRPFNDGKTYLTNDQDRLNPEILFPDINPQSFEKSKKKINNSYENKLNDIISQLNNNNKIEKTNIFWGITEKKQKEILQYEKEKLIHKKYKVGIYDCRHFVNELSLWTLNKKTPIWKLKNLI